MEKKMENEMETGGILGLKELKLRLLYWGNPFVAIYTDYGKLI